jgi:hypothetical protein
MIVDREVWPTVITRIAMTTMGLPGFRAATSTLQLHKK